MTRIQLRQATTEDVPAMTALMVSLWEWFTPEAGEEVRAEDARLPGLLALNEDEQVVGFVLWEQRVDECEVKWIAVAREHHGQGIGKMLMAAVADRARETGASRLRVATVAPTVQYEPYARTRAFYEACGFELERTQAHGWPDGTDRGDYVLRLRP